MNPVKRDFFKVREPKPRNPITWIPSVYFAMGMPFVVLSLVSVIMFADLGVDEAKITFWTSLLILPYTLKPIWSPLLELYRTKKEFVVFTQLLSGIMFGLVAFMLPLPYYFSFAIAFMAVVGFSGATHDIATDGIYLSALDKKTQAQYIGWQGAFYNIAKVLANGLLVWFAGWLMSYFRVVNPEMANTYAWMIIMGIIGGVFILLAVYHWFFLPVGSRSESAVTSFSDSMKSLWEVFRDFFTKKHIWYWIVFILCFRFAEGFAIKMVPLFLKGTIDAGGLALSNESIGLIYGTLGTLAFIAGSVLGGYYIAWLGLKRAIFSLVAFFNLPFAIYYLFALYQPSSLWIIGSGLVLEYFCYGFGFVGLILFMMQQVAAGKHSMAHYAFASGLGNLGFMIPGMMSGWYYQQVGYQWFFITALIVSIPAYLLAWRVPFIQTEESEKR